MGDDKQINNSKPISDDIIYGRQALRDKEPWIVPKALAFLRNIVRPHWYVFEWGSGGSTVWFAKNCAHIISIEHNIVWFDRVKKFITDVDVDNVNLVYIRGELANEGKRTFHNYADSILKAPDEEFDLVFVDGEASSRGWCLQNALLKIKPGGWLLLDNSDWYKGGKPAPEWERIDFVARGLTWVGQSGTFNWWTSFLRKPAAV